jgi:exopolyphosphatase / guanosine-5'-triphosphate,3'-diphosphate pyrophosphatase
VRVAVVDIGTNSTRLLIADVDPGAASVHELVRRSEVTRLGAGVDADGVLAADACERVYARLDEYAAAIAEHDCEANLAVLTSAVRDAANGREFADVVHDRYHLDARVLSGDQEAQLTFLGAMSDRPASEERTVVIDIGGGSTEFIVGARRATLFHTSLPVGVVRMSERHIHNDPPHAGELDELALEVRDVLADGLPASEREPVARAVAVAGTATSAASIDQSLDPYDPARVHGYELKLATVDALRTRLATLDEPARRAVVGLNPDRAPTIVAGMIVLAEALRAFALDRAEVSEHDILYGGALRLAGAGA